MHDEHDPSHVQQIKDLVKSLGVGGCTAVPDFEFEHCCDDHDIVYTTGLDHEGNPMTRFQADVALWKCMNKQGKTWFGRWILSSLGFLAVTFAGWSCWRGK